MGNLYLHALVVPLLLVATRGTTTLAALDPTDPERIAVERVAVERVTGGVTEGLVLAGWPADEHETQYPSDRGPDTDGHDGHDGDNGSEGADADDRDDGADGDAEEQSIGIDREDMPPVAPMIPTGCNPAMDLISSDPRFSIFRTAIEETGLDSVFGNLRLRATVFLPTNDAIKSTFEAPGASVPSPDRLLTEYVQLERLVRNHVLPMYNLGYEDMQEWGGCFDSMVEGSCIRVELDEDGEVRLGRDGAIGIDEGMRDMGGDCPTTMHAIDRLLLVDI